MRDLSFYGIRNGSVILMDERNLEEEAKQRERKAAEQKAEFDRQLHAVNSRVALQRAEAENEKKRVLQEGSV